MAFKTINRPKFHTFDASIQFIMLNTIVLGFLGGLGGPEIFLIIIVLLLFFGGKRIPELARGLGKGIKEFKDANKEASDKPKIEDPK